MYVDAYLEMHACMVGCVFIFARLFECVFLCFVFMVRCVYVHMCSWMCVLGVCMFSMCVFVNKVG